MINAIYVLIADSGLCVVDRTYGKSLIDPNLISGFLSALINFGEELSSGNKVHVIEFQNFDLCLSLKDHVIVAAAVDKLDDNNIVMSTLTKINDEFNKLFADDLASWDGNLEIFDDFKKKIDELTQNGKIAEQRVVAPKLKGKLSPMVVRFGQMSQEVYNVAVLCDGKRTAQDIAKELGAPLVTVQKHLTALEDMKMIKWIDIK